MTDLHRLLDAAYCRSKHAGEHLGRPEGCGSLVVDGMAEDPEVIAAFSGAPLDAEWLEAEWRSWKSDHVLGLDSGQFAVAMSFRDHLAAALRDKTVDSERHIG